jgi:hypothetical protein
VIRRTRQKPTAPVGTRVLVPFPMHKMEAVVIEHRGFIGVGGRELVRVQPLDPEDHHVPFEVPVDEIEILPEPVGSEPGPAAPRRLGRPRGEAAAHLPVGAQVRVQLPHSLLNMEVMEDLGTVGGRQIVRVRSLDEGYVSSDLEVAAADVEVLSLPPARRGRAAA